MDSKRKDIVSGSKFFFIQNKFIFLLVFLKGKFILKQNPKETKETTFSLGFLQVKIKRDFSCLETDMKQQKKQRKRIKNPKESE